ncbi:MAG TPA: hypothetical protein VNK91_02115 [Burkholderiaceae bacterium]|nr:hypothetical protein [Burkholderiaceae bacterium]
MTYGLINGRGEWLAYRHREYGMRFAASPRLARMYATERNAKIACGVYRYLDPLRELSVSPLNAEACRR